MIFKCKAKYIYLISHPCSCSKLWNSKVPSGSTPPHKQLRQTQLWTYFTTDFLSLFQHKRNVGKLPKAKLLNLSRYMEATEGISLKFLIILIQPLGRFSLQVAISLFSVMSMNIQIFKKLNKMALKYYFYLYLCHLPSMNTFWYSLVDFWTSKYIRIFVCEFIKIRIHFNIWSETYFNVSLSIFNEKSIFL